MGFVAQSRAMDDIGPCTFVAARFAVASLVVAPFALRESRRATVALDGAVLRPFALIGAVLFLGMAAQQVGLLSTTVTNSGFLTGLYVVLTPLLGIVLFKDRPHPIVWPAAALSLAGIALLSGGAVQRWVVGDALTVLSAVFWALQVLLIARFVTRSDRPLALALVQFVVTALLAAACALVFETVALATLRQALPSVLYAGVFASALAFTLQIIGQRWTTAPQAAIMLSSEAPFAALFGFVVLGERLGVLALFGCALILSAMLLVELVPALRRSFQVEA